MRWDVKTGLLVSRQWETMTLILCVVFVWQCGELLWKEMPSSWLRLIIWLKKGFFFSVIWCPTSWCKLNCYGCCQHCFGLLLLFCAGRSTILTLTFNWKQLIKNTGLVLALTSVCQTVCKSVLRIIISLNVSQCRVQRGAILLQWWPATNESIWGGVFGSRFSGCLCVSSTLPLTSSSICLS